MDAQGKCEHCGGMGLVTVYHRFYEGSQDVYYEHTGRGGEVRTIKAPGTIAAHCMCRLGEWMRDNTEEKIRERIPSLIDVLARRTNYQATDPTDEMDMTLPTSEALAFLRRWKAGLPRFFALEIS